VASSKKDLLEFPDEVRQEIGYALYFAQAASTRQPNLSRDFKELESWKSWRTTRETRTELFTR
jgi:phage-related protein